MELKTSTWRILHIDDDEDDHIIINSMLSEAQGRKVTLDWAPTFEAGRQMLQANHYQAVLVDYDLGAHTGIQLIREFVIRRYPAPLILLTGRGSYEVDVEAMYAGATLYLTKNEINPLLLERSIRYAIERKQYEQDLLERDRKLSVALDAAQLGTWIYSFDNHMLEMDARAQELYASEGLDRRDHDEIVRQHVYPDDVPAMWAALSKAADPTGDGRYQAEYRILHPDGSVCWLNAWGLAAFEGEGANRRAVRLTGASRDVTSERSLQAENHQQKERLERLIQAAPVAIAFLKGPQHIFELANPLYRLIARGRGALAGRPMTEVWPEVAGIIGPQLDYVFQTGEALLQVDAPFTLLRDGILEEAFFTYSYTPIFSPDGSIEGIMELSVETSDTVRERQASQAETERLEAVLNALPVGVWITDQKGTIIRKNRQADEIWAGDAPLSEIGDYREYLAWDPETGKVLAPEDYPLARTIRTGEPVAPHEQGIRRFDGSAGTVLVSVQPIKNQAGRLVGAVAINADLTGLKQAEQALKANEERYRTLFETMQEGLAIVEPVFNEAGEAVDFRYVDVNLRTQEYLQRPYDQIVGHTYRQVAARPDPAWIAMIGRAAASTNPLQLEMYSPMWDRWMQVRAYAFQPGQVAFFYSDVTERKQAEERLQERDTMLLEALESTHDMVFVLDRDWRFQYVNRRFTETYQSFAADFIGKMIWEVFPRYVGTNLEQQYRKVMEERVAVQFELGSRYFDDLWFEISAYPTPGGITVFTSNRTEEKKAQQALTASRESYRRLADNSPEVIARFDRELRHTYINAYGATVYGWPQEEVLGKTNAELGMPAGQVAFWNEHFEQVFATGRQQTVEFEFDSPNLGHQYFSSLFVPEFDPQGQVASILAITRDVTELHQAAEMLQTYNEQLEHSNRDLQEFAYVASHDLQEPLRKVRIFADSLQKSLQGKLTGAEQDQFERMQRAARRMQQMIEDLLELSRVTTQGRPFEPVDLGQVARQVVSDLEERLALSGGQVVTGRLPTIQADPSQMEHLLLNLVGNAIKYQAEGRPPLVRVSGRVLAVEGRELAEIQVADNGIGFEMAYAELIFQPFKRLHGISRYEGSGIGLAICKRIVERHSGTITAESQPGEGSTFTVRIPVR